MLDFISPILAADADTGAPPAGGEGQAAPAEGGSNTTAGTQASGSAKPAEGAPPQQGQGQFGSLIMMIGIFLVIIYLFMWRPQKKQKQERQEMLTKLKKNDKVVTIGGIHGTIQQVKAEEQKVIVRIDDKTNMTFSLSAVQTINPKKAEEQKP
ncbi:MAG: preprotein translocase subunit YajC [Planctomycetota bacterium]